MQAPRDAEVLDTFGYVLLKNGKTAEAAPLLARAQQELPGNPAISYHMALASNALGKRSEAIMHLQRALEERTFEERSAAIALLAKLSGSAGERHD
jgi:predicted Zn-dependent protease